LAANSDIAAAMNNPTIDYELGIQTTHAMLEYARLNSVEEFVFSSGSGVYGDVPGRIFDEDSFVGRPTSTYGATKLSCEALISAYSFMFGLKSTVFRFCNLVGKNQTHGVVFDFIQKLKINPETLEVLGNGTQTKPYIHLDDAIEGIFKALDNQITNFEVFNVSNTTTTSVRQIADMVVERVGNSTTQIEYGSADRGWKADIPNYLMSSDKLSKFGWQPRLDSTEAVLRSIEENLS
jgi:UDP-glucose 4-epimerase